MEPTDAPPRPDAPADAMVDAMVDDSSDATAPEVEVTARSAPRRGVSIATFLATLLVVGALSAGFITIWSLNSELNEQEALVADLQDQVGALETDVAGNAQAVADAAARADDIEERADSLETQVEASGGSAAPSEDPAVAANSSGALPPFVGNGQPDGAIGQELPEIAGVDHLTGEELAIADGTPAMIMVWAHWCPFCQEELPVVEQLYVDGVFEDAGVDLLTIATFEDPERGNPFEPYVEDFTLPVIRDDRSRAALLGMDGVPSWVAVDGDGVVIGRISGRLGDEAIRSIIDQVAAA